jgi:iron complex outermembrane receptor protein
MGYRLAIKNLSLSANLYFMEYRDQLVPTGRLSETGYVIKENVDKSYRRGLEITTSWRPLSLLSFDGNLTLSSNKILDYTQFLDQFDGDWNFITQKQVTYSKTDISFSPSATGMVMVTIHPFAKTTFSLNGKYVGKQFLDNTSNESKSVPSYFLTGFSATRSFELKKSRYLDLFFFVDNLLNKSYFSNGWVYSAVFTNGIPYVEEGLYPQAGINFTVKASLRF